MEKFEVGDRVRRKGTTKEMHIGQKDMCENIDTGEEFPIYEDKEWCCWYEATDSKQQWDKFSIDDLELVSRFPDKPNVP
ncbi:hypothetical protein FACS189452_02460 [Bacteroidia bacterium]|nr:hypothetical protein FACS189452_02460 [Bacteroidia bacterium]